MRLKRITASIAVALVLALQSPLVAWADTTDPAPVSDQTQTATPTTDPAPAPSSDPAPSTDPTPAPAPDPAPTTGPSKPTGKAPDYAFNDALRKWEPTIISSFTWDPSTGYWVSPFYTYEPTVGWYHVKPKVTPSDAVNGLTAGSADPAGTLRQILGSDPANSNTGPNSHNNSTLNNSNNLLAQLINNMSVTNFGAQTALSGDATVAGNNTAGDARSGMTSVVSNLLNLLNAMWTWGGGGFNYFAQNLFGNHTGDINIVTPAVSGGGGQMGVCVGGLDSNDTTGPGSTNNATSNCNDNMTVNSQTNGSITNNIDMQARSGGATVAGNTRGGNATTGDAQAELNIVNLINSAIGAGQSFFGVLNVYGNLNGDILFPGLGLSGAVGSSSSSPSAVSNTQTGPNSTNNSAANNTNNATVNNTNNATVNNNIVTDARSGSATEAGNTTGGDATTGDAKTSSSLFNLFDTSVFGQNAILVLVNDAGHWVGHLLGLPGSGDGSVGGLLTSAGTTVSNNNTGPNSTNNSAANNTNNLGVTNTTNSTITNNVKVGARSGDATVADNTIGGNATTGNASILSNVANLIGSHLSFRGIFGILIINLMPGATWNGSVGIDTAAGNFSTPQSAAPLTAHSGNTTVSTSNLASQTGGGGSVNSVTTTTNISTQSLSDAQVIAAQLQAEQAQGAASSQGMTMVFLIAAGFMMAAAGLFGLERKFSKR